MQGCNFNISGRGFHGVYPAKILSVILVLVTVIEQMVLGPVSCPEKVRCSAVFAMRNCQLSRRGGEMTHPHTLLPFLLELVHCFSLTKYTKQ